MALAEAIHSDDLTERMIALAQVPHFRGLTPADRAALAATLRERRFGKGDVIARENEPADSFFLLAEGRVRLSRRGTYWRTLEPPAGLGYMAMISRSASGSGAVAETDVRVFEMDRASMEETFEDHVSVLLESIRLVATAFVEQMRLKPPLSKSLGRVDHDPAFVDPGRPLDLVERIVFLRGAPAFASSNVNALAELSQRLAEKRFAAGSIVWRPGDEADHAMLLVSGKVELVRDDGRTQTFDAGASVGGGEALAGLRRWNTLRVLEPTLALVSYREAMLDVFEDNHDVAQDFLAMIARTLMRLWDESPGGEEPGEAALSASERPR